MNKERILRGDADGSSLSTPSQKMYLLVRMKHDVIPEAYFCRAEEAKTIEIYDD